MRRYALLVVPLLLFTGAAARDAVDRWIDRTELPVLVAEHSVEMLDRKGRLLRAMTVADGRWRLGVSLDQVDPRYIDYLLAYEDKRFYRHTGVDLIAMSRAVGQAVWHGEVISGGSTLTMQVARLLEESGTGKIKGKVRQMRLAWALERHLTKDEILTLYLNRAPFGGNLEGMRAATLAYFGKEPRRLTPAEAALLVALPQSPETRRPDRHAKSARAARDRVLARMVGKGVLAEDEADAALFDPVPTARKNFPADAPHLMDRMVAANPLQTLHRTTLDRDLQRALQSLAAEAVRHQGARLSVALMVADHHTGEVLATVGSAGYLDQTRAGGVDMTRILRSPGSTLKPLVYGLAFDEGLAHPETLIDDRPTAFGRYEPVNFDGIYRGTLSVREALQLSLNIPVVSLTEALGPPKLMAGMRRAGMTPELPGGTPGLAVALGGVGVTLEDLLRLYGGLARGGRAMPLSYQGSQDQAQPPILSRQAAWQVGHILAGIAPPPHAPRIPLAYKTGTSYGHRDAWAVGYGGRHVAGVWFGRPDGTAVPGVFGGDLAAPVLFELFTRVAAEPTPLPAPPPEALLLAQSQLPQPLRHFRPYEGAAATNGLKLAFPPQGAVVETSDGDLAVKIRNGRPPFTLLVNGQPVSTKVIRRELTVAHPDPGFVALAVIDANGHSAQSQIELR